MIRSVKANDVMGVVEIEAGPFLIAAAITRDAIDELELSPGVLATAVVPPTSVIVERAATSLELGP